MHPLTCECLVRGGARVCTVLYTDYGRASGALAMARDGLVWNK